MLIWINVDARSWRSFTHRATCNIAAASAELRPGRIGLIAQDRSTKRALCKQAPPISINTGEKMDREVKIWDPVVRIGHWMVVVAFAVAYLVEDELLTVHVWAGYIAGAAVALRILWGFVGPERARFSNFVYGPRTIVTYLSDLARFRATRYLGHSPAGGAMAVALLAMLAGTVITGLMAYGADKKAGPLAPLYAAGEPLGLEGQRARSDQGGSTKQDGEESTIGELHDFLANLTLILVLVHVTGVALASIAHRENLVAAMITGRKRAENHRPETGRGPVIGQ